MNIVEFRILISFSWPKQKKPRKSREIKNDFVRNLYLFCFFLVLSRCIVIWFYRLFPSPHRFYSIKFFVAATLFGSASHRSFHRVYVNMNDIILFTDQQPTVGKRCLCMCVSYRIQTKPSVQFHQATCTSVNERLNAFNVFEAKIKISDEPNWSHTHMRFRERER